MVSLHKLQSDKCGHDFGQTGHFPLLIFSLAYIHVIFLIVEQEMSGSYVGAFLFAEELFAEQIDFVLRIHG
jgi:hypothetical protein